MPEAILARQPIYNRDLDIVAYELLFRGDRHHIQADISDGDAATSRLIANAFENMDLQSIVGRHKAFINLTRPFILGELPLPEKSDQVVLEVLEDIVTDRELIRHVQRLSEEGYHIALDDFGFHEDDLPLLAIADYVKVDIKSLPRGDLRAHLDTLKKYDLVLLAEKIETRGDYYDCKSLGFDLYQGYFLSEPTTIVAGQTMLSHPRTRA